MNNTPTEGELQVLTLPSRTWQDFQEPNPKNQQYRLLAMGDLLALNDAKRSKAAQLYTDVGWRIAPMWLDGYFVRADPGYRFTSDLWKRRRPPGIGIETGAASGVVGLRVDNLRTLALLEDKCGPLPYPRIVGKDIVICFRAPIPRYRSRNISPGLNYVGEGDLLMVPTSRKWARLEWLIGQMDLSLGLPNLPWWLYCSL